MRRSLRRFTQCSSITMFAAIFVVIFSLSSTALTTFGINNNNKIQPAAPTVAPKGRECISNPDCASIGGTSCVKDYDQRLRCLCGDYRAPINGLCQSGFKGLRHQCNINTDCEDYMICRENNITKSTLLSGKDKNPKKGEKLCFCDEENGFMENVIEKHCNAAVSNFIAGAFGYVFAVIFYFAVTQKFLTY